MQWQIETNGRYKATMFWLQAQHIRIQTMLIYYTLEILYLWHGKLLQILMHPANFTKIVISHNFRVNHACFWNQRSSYINNYYSHQNAVGKFPNAFNQSTMNH